MRWEPGPTDAVTDVEGVRVGHHHRIDPRWATGTTAVLVPDGATTAVDVRGGGPGTRETDALDPAHLVQQAHAVVLTGGSAYGLAAADGATRWLGERGRGFAVGERPGEVVPIVPAAVLFDLPMGDWGNRPDADFGYRACEAADAGEASGTGASGAARGNVGAGAGLVAGHVRGGIGTASALLPGGAAVGALVAVNAAGSVIDPDDGLPLGVDRGREADFGLRAPAADEVAAARERAAQRPGRTGPAAGPLNSTVGVVATDLGTTKAEAQRLAVAAQDGLARAVRPAHGMADGDTVFTIATGARGGLPAAGGPEWARALDRAAAAAADAVQRAIVHALLAAETLGDVSSYTDLYPSARE